MKSVPLKSIALRYLCAVVLITVAGLFASPTSLFLLIPVAVVGIKFLVYDVTAALIKGKFPTFRVKPWLLIGYALAVAGDMLFTYGSAQDGTDAGFAFLGTIVITPWVLIGALATMLLATILSRKK